MDNLIILFLGILVGIGFGSFFTAIAKPQKPWSELNDKEKKIRLWMIAIAVLIFIAGIIVLLSFF